MLINELEYHINHGIHVICIVFGEHSFIIVILISVQKHIQKNLATYCDLLRQDSLFAAKVLYVVDVRIQNFLKNCQQGIFSTAPLDFSNMWEQIVQNRSFNARLPSSLVKQKKRKPQDKDTEEGQGQTLGRYRSKDRGAWVKNNKVNPEWKLKDNENFGTVFHANRDMCPKREGILICSNFHIRGSCYESCRFDHKNIDRGTPTHTQMNKYCAACRSGNF